MSALGNWFYSGFEFCGSVLDRTDDAHTATLNWVLSGRVYLLPLWFVGAILSLPLLIFPSLFGALVFAVLETFVPADIHQKKQ